MNYFCVTALLLPSRLITTSWLYFLYLVSAGWIHPDALGLDSLEANDNVTLGKRVQKIVIGNFVFNTVFMECDRRWEE